MEEPFLQSPIGAVFLFNSLLTGLETDIRWSSWFHIVQVLLCIFVFELGMRLKPQGLLRQVRGHSWTSSGLGRVPGSRLLRSNAVFGPLVARRVNNVQSAPWAGVLTGLTEKLFEVAQDNLITEAEFNAKMLASSLLFAVLDAIASTMPFSSSIRTAGSPRPSSTRRCWPQHSYSQFWIRCSRY